MEGSDDSDLESGSSDSNLRGPQGHLAQNQSSYAKPIVPASVLKLREELLGDYKCPKDSPQYIPMQPLTPEEELSLKHYIAWKESNGTVKAYGLHGKVLSQATNISILSLYKVRKLCQKITELEPKMVDVCPQSCIAYTGKYQNLVSCPFKRDKTVCGELRYKTSKSKKSKAKPQAQVMILPVVATIKALFACEETSHLMRQRDQVLKETLHLVGTALKKEVFSDFANGKVHQKQYQDLGIFQEYRDTGWALSTDGAQLTMKKHSNTWLCILILLNLPAEMRYKSENIIIVFATPGPNSPGDIESFL
ncbi:hypothetical protein BDN72DRAFT_763557, partial [Pluteus cervinus]